jgi:ATP phosphoribosyltransferase
MTTDRQFRLAIQKTGRLNTKCINLITQCDIRFEAHQNQLLSRAENFPIELMLVRDDDIPDYVRDGVCDIGIVGLNELRERVIDRYVEDPGVEIIKPLGFGKCRLSIALPYNLAYDGPDSLKGLKIATSHPTILERYLEQRDISATVVKINGAVEVAPAIGVADAICDLVSTGATLQSNGLREVETILLSEAVLFKRTTPISPDKNDVLTKFKARIEGVLRAQKARYIMMNAPKSSIDLICRIVPGMERPTILPLSSSDDKVAIHAVTYEEVFWDAMEQLKEVGASSILVTPIEKIFV